MQGSAADDNPDVRADGGGWISGPGLHIPGGQRQHPDRLTIAR